MKQQTVLSRVRAAAMVVCALVLMPVSAAAKPVLTIYTYDAFAADWGPGPKIARAFGEVCDCTVRFVQVETSIGILRKVQLEGVHSEADIVLGLDTSMADIARQTGLFAHHGVDKSVLAHLDLPLAWSNSVFLPFDYGQFAFVYRRDELPRPPDSFSALIEADPELRIIIQDPRSSTPGLGLVLWLKAAYGDGAANIWRALSPRILSVTRSWSDAYNMFVAGEAEMVLSYSTSPAYHRLVEDDDSYDWARFKEGHYLQIEVAARLAASRQPELSRRFMTFILSREFQATIAEGNWMFPSADTAPPLPDSFGSPPILVLPMVRPEVVARKSSDWIREWRESVLAP